MGYDFFVDGKVTDHFFLFFFASPKKNQKRSPTNDDGPFVGNSYVDRLYYCGLYIGNSILRMPTLQFIATSFCSNRLMFFLGLLH